MAFYVYHRASKIVVMMSSTEPDIYNIADFDVVENPNELDGPGLEPPKVIVSGNLRNATEDELAGYNVGELIGNV